MDSTNAVGTSADDGKGTQLPCFIETLFGNESALEKLVRAVPECDRYALALSYPGSALTSAVHGVAEHRDDGKKTVSGPEGLFRTPATMEWIVYKERSNLPKIFPERGPAIMETKDSRRIGALASQMAPPPAAPLPREQPIFPVFLRPSVGRMGLVGRFGSLDTLKYAYEVGFATIDSEISMTDAARGGKLENMKWMHAKGCSIGPTTFQVAAIRGDVETLRWMREVREVEFPEPQQPFAERSVFAKIVYAAFYGGHIPAIRFMLEWVDDGTPTDHETGCEHTTAAAEGGHLHALKWLHSFDPPCPWDEDACTWAARGGHLKTLQYLVHNGCPFNEGIFAKAARGGHIPILEWAFAELIHVDEFSKPGFQTCMEAAGKDLETLKWLRSQDPPCPWDERTCAYAAGNGNLEVLRYARGNGCPWDVETCLYAALGGHPDTLDWALDNGCLLDSDAQRDPRLFPRALSESRESFHETLQGAETIRKRWVQQTGGDGGTPPPYDDRRLAAKPSTNTWNCRDHSHACWHLDKVMHLKGMPMCRDCEIGWSFSW